MCYLVWYIILIPLVIFIVKSTELTTKKIRKETEMIERKLDILVSTQERTRERERERESGTRIWNNNTRILEILLQRRNKANND